MSLKLRIAVLNGDGIGPEVNREAVKVLNAAAEVYGIRLETVEGSIGGDSIRTFGLPITRETLDNCLSANAVLLGAVGAPEFDGLDPRMRPESGLLALRKELGGFANLRPAFAVPELLDSSPLRPEIAARTDLLIVRELLGGLYFGDPRGFSPDRRSAWNTLTYSVGEVERVARIAFEMAKRRRGKLTSVDKANVLETSRLWRDTVESVASDYPDVDLDHVYVDACAMHLVTDPSRFDVILTENLFGDILSDEASILCGSLGMLASATIGGTVDLYEPVHGSAPDIAGSNTANPLGAIESAAMLLEHTAQRPDAAFAVRSAVRSVLSAGYRTVDIAGNGESTITISTSGMGDTIATAVTAEPPSASSKAA